MHGTWGVNDGWINGATNFVAVTEISLTWNGGTQKYDFGIDTTNSFLYDGLYVECKAT